MNLAGVWWLGLRGVPKLYWLSLGVILGHTSFFHSGSPRSVQISHSRRRAKQGLALLLAYALSRPIFLVKQSWTSSMLACFSVSWFRSPLYLLEPSLYPLISSSSPWARRIHVHSSYHSYILYPSLEGRRVCTHVYMMHIYISRLHLLDIDDTLPWAFSSVL